MEPGTNPHVIKEKTNVPSYPEQRRGVRRASQPERHVGQDRQVDGAAVVGLPHQPCGRRRGRSGHPREACAVRSTASPRRTATSQDGVSMVQTAEGNLDEVHCMLQRVRELAVQYKNGTLARPTAGHPVRGQPARVGDRAHRSSAKFNGITLLNASGAVTVPGRRERRPVDHGRHDLAGHRGRRDVFTLYACGDSTAIAQIDAAITTVVARLARRSVRSRTASSTRSRPARSTRRT